LDQRQLPGCSMSSCSQKHWLQPCEEGAGGRDGGGGGEEEGGTRRREGGGGCQKCLRVNNVWPSYLHNRGIQYKEDGPSYCLTHIIV